MKRGCVKIDTTSFFMQKDFIFLDVYFKRSKLGKVYQKCASSDYSF